MHYLFAAAIALLGGVLPVAASPVITEFLASNSGGLRDADGAASDWVEIHNPAAVPVDLGGWYLTDNAANRTKWQFPAVVIPARGYLLVFASGKDRRDAGKPLHTNFSLGAAGEYLGLIMPDGATAASEFSPAFPVQFGDISYGVPGNADDVLLLAQDASARWSVPVSSQNPGPNWQAPAFDDSQWNAATLGIGFDRNISGVNYLPEIGPGGNTESEMYNRQTSCYVRIPFSVESGAEIQSLRLLLKYEDGFAAWVNGVPLVSNGNPLRRNAPATLGWNSVSAGENLDANAIRSEEFDITDSIGSMVEGVNVLSFHLLNRSLTSSDLLLRPELHARVLTEDDTPRPPAYFSSPTPGQPNAGAAGMVVPQAVAFSRQEGTFSGNFLLDLGGQPEGMEIRYTTDGRIPTATSLLYAGPIAINGSRTIRARVYDPATGALGFVGTRLYEKMEASLASYGSTGQPFKSSLPLLVINNRGAGEPANNDVYVDARVHVIDRDASGYASINAAPVLSIDAGFKIRGSSSSGFAKKSYGMEFRDEAGRPTSRPLLGMPEGEDWALISCDQFDPAFMRNAWVYEQYRQSGRWAPRTRLVEVYFNFNGDNLSYTQNDYRGVYLLCENVRRSGDRVDITRIERSDISIPGVTGGYIFKVDRADSDEFRWNSRFQQVVIHRPKLPNLAPQQSAYLVDYVRNFENALVADAGNRFVTRNYTKYIEPVSWVDHNLFNAIAKNVDALRLSAYYHKDRGRRIEGGALWDFDRSADSYDSRDDAFNTWRGGGDATDYFTNGWWQPLFQDLEFRQLYVDRWHEHRRGALSTLNIHLVLERFLAEFRVGDGDHPARRDYAKWYGSPTARDIVNETNRLKSWLTNRANWIDSQFAGSPVLGMPGGQVPQGQTVSLGIPAGTTVYYTLDGSDPRIPGGGISGRAIAYNGTPVAINDTTHLTARARRAGTSFVTPATGWSGPVSALYLVEEDYANAGNSRVSGIHYNPLAPSAGELALYPELDASDFEWIELENISDGPINLEGVSFVKGSPVSSVVLAPFTLQPGERGVVVKNVAAFLLRYPDAAGRVVGEWTGDKRLDNGGEEIWIQDAGGGTLARFEYNDGGNWPSLADGAGSALVYLGNGGEKIDYENAGNWRASAIIHGTPGLSAPDPAPRVAINEILANSDLPWVDAIELRNISEQEVDLSGWFISNANEPLTGGDFQKFRVPDGTILGAGGHVVFTEQDFNPDGAWNPQAGGPDDSHFSLDGHRGGTVWLISADAATGALRRIEDVAEFGPALEGVSVGRWPDGSGSFIPLAGNTLFSEESPEVPRPGMGGANTGPRVGPVQVSELMYHPEPGGSEFIELVNAGDQPESLEGWTLRGDVDYYFRPGDILDPGHNLIVVPFDPAAMPAVAAAFREYYKVPGSTALVGPWVAGRILGDLGGVVRLWRAVPPPPAQSALVGLMVEDLVSYQAAAPWPSGASGTGHSIHRLGVTLWGSDPTSWAAAPPTPGRDSGEYPGWLVEHFETGDPLAGPLDDFDADGIPNQLEYLMGTDPRAASALPATTSLVTEGGEDEPITVLVLDYLLRRDRGDHQLRAWQSFDLENWEPAADDETVGWEGLFELRQARLPVIGQAGYLRLGGDAPPP